MENTTSLLHFFTTLPPTTEANLFFTRAKNRRRESTQVGTKQSTRDFQFYVRVFIFHEWNAVAEHTERCYRAATFQPSPAFSSSLAIRTSFMTLSQRLSLSASSSFSSFPWRDRVIDVPLYANKLEEDPRRRDPLLEFCKNPTIIYNSNASVDSLRESDSLTLNSGCGYG